MTGLNKKISVLINFIFYGNYFYGICAIALSVEATLQQRFPLNGFWYFLLVFLATVLFYSYPYIKKSLPGSNARTNWYTHHYHLMYWNQVAISIVLITAAILFLKNYWQQVLHMHRMNWLLIVAFPVIAASYYGMDMEGKMNTRKIGWLKPFIIGVTWAGIANVYPVLFYDIIHELPYEITEFGTLLFLKNFMFIAVLCIMFDIKDYSSDYLASLKTFVVKLGLRRTIFYVLLPLSVMGLGSFIYYAETQHFSQMRVFLNVIPFLLLLAAAWGLRKRRSILYYLVVIDGLMLIKAICGTIAISYF